MSTLRCNVESLFPSPNNMIDILSSITHAVGDLLNVVYLRVTEPLTQYSLETCIKQSDKIQKQLLVGFSSFGKSDFNSRLNLRSMLGLSTEFEEDARGIEQLCGSISWMTNDKVDVTMMLRTLRDNE